MTIYVHDDLNDFALERIKATITTSELDEWNRYSLLRCNGAVIDRFVAVEWRPVQIECDLRPSEVVEVFNNDRRACDCDLRFDWWLTCEEDCSKATMIKRTTSAMIPMMSSGFVRFAGGAPHDGQLLGFKLMIFWPHWGHVTSAIKKTI